MVDFDGILKSAPIIAILRGVTLETVESAAEALLAGGIRFVEVTLNSPDALRSIELLAQRFSAEELIIGAGTVTTAPQAAQVAIAGGKYIISPNTNPAVIRKTKELGLVSIPGFYTPTEAFTAVEAGADYLKCFPVRNLGESYIKDLKAVLTKPIIAVGGVDLNNMAVFLKVCAGVGIGSNLYSLDKTPEQLKALAEQYVAKVKGV